MRESKETNRRDIEIIVSECRARDYLADRLAGSSGQDERDDESVEAEHFGEDENEDHADVEARLLGGAAHARVAHDADREAGRQTRQAHAQARAQMVETLV